MKTRPPWFYTQSAVIPFRLREGVVEVLLITSLSKGRWIVPKGVIDPGTTAAESALKEAYEEAGVRGRISRKPLGEYRHEKWGGTCTVQLFLLEVEEVLETWPEAESRRREWMTVEQAANAVGNEELKNLIRSFADGPAQSEFS